ncbi:MAG: toxin-antitoxin system HicB family antitoxin [Alphaproteobacteria bacterium]|nr:toxin-antitoxin system HicB family antitoxin [Alphaproteobacteria bacterium]
MARVTLRLPDSLHKQLAAQAEAEGVSMNQYLVYALAQVSTAADIAAQQAKYEELTNRVPDDDAEADLRALLSSRAS